VVALLFAAALAAAASPLVDRPFRLEGAAEGILALEAGCEACDWGARGREAAVLRVEVDGAYSQHVVLFRGAAGTYRLLLGPLAAGEHRLRVTVDRRRSARGAGAATVTAADVEAVPADDPRHDVVAGAPVLHARPGSLERFSDVPLLLYAESAAVAGREEHRYSYVFSNEDGGTPPDRLMATWGRVTDIELAVSRVSDHGGLRETIQARDHVVRPFAGARLGAHPVLYVATRNNMFGDRGKRTVRFAPAPQLVDLRGTSREAVMDANDWTYRVSAQEVRREGRVAPPARPGRGRIPDPSSFAFLEACGAVEGAGVAFDLELEGGRRVASDAGNPRLRIGRSGCFRAAVALPRGTAVQAIRAVRVRAHAAPLEKGRAAGTPSVRLDRLNRLFLLAADDRPGPSVLGWDGPAALPIDGPPLVVPVVLAP